MHRHACIEVCNTLITSNAVEITIIITIPVLLSTHVVIIKIHACLCSALPFWSQKLPRNRSFCVGLREEVPHVIPVVAVHTFMYLPLLRAATGGRSLVILKNMLKAKKKSPYSTYLFT